MKKLEFRNLIREEIRRVLKEASDILPPIPPTELGLPSNVDETNVFEEVKKKYDVEEIDTVRNQEKRNPPVTIYKIVGTPYIVTDGKFNNWKDRSDPNLEHYGFIFKASNLRKLKTIISSYNDGPYYDGMIQYSSKDPNKLRRGVSGEAKRMYASKEFIKITSTSKILPGTILLGLNSGIYYTVKRVEGSVYYLISGNADSAKDGIKKTKEELEEWYLMKNPQKK
jgi:hypothetical protein